MSNKRLRVVLGTLSMLAALSFLISFEVLAAEPDTRNYPARPIMLYTPFPGYNDVMARVISEKMAQDLGQAIVVQNLPGGSGGVAAAKVKAAAADGYTLLYGSNGMFTVSELFNPKMEYKPADFAPISLAYVQPMLLLVSTSLPVKNLTELIAYAKANPDKLTFGSSGVGTITHVAGEVLKSTTGAPISHIPYKGTAQALTDLIGGRIDLLFFPPEEAMQYINSNKVKVFAVSTKERSRLAPDVPTLVELGYPNFDVKVWYGFFAPAKTPKPVIQTLQKAIAKAIKALDLDVKDMSGGGNTSAAYEQMIRDDRASLGKLIKDSTITLN